MSFYSLLAVPLLSALEIGTENYPYLILSNKTMTLKVMLPDAENGYYRATRFEWSGVIPEGYFLDHSLFGNWILPHEPESNPHGAGPIEEFNEPMGFDEAQNGDPFLKIGVGLLEKTDEPYGKRVPYRVLEPGTWKVRKKGSKGVQFRQEMSTELGYSYRYEKQIELSGMGFRISHSFKNTGDNPIRTSHYCHNYFMFDGKATGPGYRILFDTTAQMEKRSNRPIIMMNKEITLSRELDNGETFGTHIYGISGVENYSFHVENTQAGMGVTVSGNYPLDYLFLWMSDRSFCPEPAIMLDLKPGESREWSIAYVFYELNK